mgnify:FL=1
MNRAAAVLLSALLTACRPVMRLGHEEGWIKPELPVPAQVLPVPSFPAQTPALRIRAGRGALWLDIEPPAGHRLQGPLRCRVSEKSGPIFFDDRDRKFALDRPRLPFLLPFRTEPGQSQLRVVVEFYHCRKGGSGPCFLQTAYQSFVLNAEREAEKAVLPVRLRVDSPR